jgi:hypothetical protein
MAKKKTVIEVDYKVKGADKVEDTFEGISTEAEKAAESTDKVNKSMEDTGKSAKKAEGGIGGLLDGFKAIVMNPIGAVVIALVAAFKFVQGAMASSEGASNKLSQGFAYLQGFIVPLQKAVVSGFMLIADAVASPGEAFDSMVTGIENGIEYFKNNVIQPYLSVWKIMGLKIFQEITKIQLAWNKFTGDDEDADALQLKLESITDDIAKNQKIITDAAKTIKNDVVGAIDAVVDGVTAYVKAADVLGDKLSTLKKREQDLLIVRRQQEVQNAKSLADIEALKIIRDDEAQSLQDRIKANEEIGIIEKKRVADALSLAKQELALTQANIALKGRSTELLDEEKDKLVAIQELRSESAGIENEQVVNKTALMTEEFDKQSSLIDKEQELLAIREQDAVKLADAQVAAAQRKLDALTELGLEEKAIYIEQQNALEIAVATADQAKIDAAIETANKLDEQKDKDVIKDKKLFDEKVKTADKTIALADQLASVISDIKLSANDAEQTALDKSLADGVISEEEYNVEKQRLADEAYKIQRNAALAKIGIDTASAISSLVAAANGNPLNLLTGGVAGIVQFAAGAVSIAANMASASALLKGSAPTVDTGSAGGVAPRTNDTSADLGFEGRSAGAEQFGAQVIKAYVTESDITQSQTNATNIQELSQIG